MVVLDQGGRLSREAMLRPPPAPLRGLVESSFVLSTETEDSDRWLIVPDMSAHILLHYEDHGGVAVLSGARVVGARTRATEVSVRNRSHSVGLRLRPGALTALTGMPGGELLDRGIDVSELWGARAQDFLSGVTTSGPEEARAALLRFLVQQGGPDVHTDWRIRGFATCLGEAGCRSVDGAARQLGLGGRTLRKAVRQAIGFGPKHFHRIQRLYRGASTAVRDRSMRGAAVAATAGYSDQAHMIREFRALLGDTPRKYLARSHG